LWTLYGVKVMLRGNPSQRTSPWKRLLRYNQKWVAEDVAGHGWMEGGHLYRRLLEWASASSDHCGAFRSVHPTQFAAMLDVIFWHRWPATRSIVLKWTNAFCISGPSTLFPMVFHSISYPVSLSMVNMGIHQDCTPQSSTLQWHQVSFSLFILLLIIYNCTYRYGIH